MRKEIDEAKHVSLAANKGEKKHVGHLAKALHGGIRLKITWASLLLILMAPPRLLLVMQRVYLCQSRSSVSRCFSSSHKAQTVVEVVCLNRLQTRCIKWGFVMFRTLSWTVLYMAFSCCLKMLLSSIMDRPNWGTRTSQGMAGNGQASICIDGQWGQSPRQQGLRTNWGIE